MGSHQHLINHDFYNIPNLFVDLRSQEDFFDMTLATTEQIKNQFKAHKGGLISERIFTLAEISKNVTNHYPPKEKIISIEFIRWFHEFPVLTTNLRIFRETEFVYLFLCTVNDSNL